MKKYSLIFLVLFFILPVGSFAQEKKAGGIHITGTVRDNATLLPIPNAKLSLLRLGLKATTDARGKFNILIPAKASVHFRDTLVVTNIKYWEKQVEVWPTKTTDLTIALSAAKQRLIVTTDIGGTDPDDEQSMVHLLVSSNEVDIEGIVCGLAWINDKTGLDVLNSIIDAYGQSLPNFRVHADGFPSVEYLKSVSKTGQPQARMSAVGDGKDSPGSDLIIDVVDKDDPRPVWLNAWGGANTIAQALWKIQHTRTPEQVNAFIHKIRIYDVLGQDDAGAWIAKTFPNLIYIRNKAIYGWAPSDEWVKQNVQSRGALGAKYRKRIWAIEGDSPAFMQVIANGLSDPNAIDQGNWGGRFALTKVPNIRSMDIAVKSGIDESGYDPYLMYTNTSEGIATIKKWKAQILSDLAERMKWSVENSYKNADHPPLAILNGDATKQVLEYDAKANSLVKLDASRSTDPDGDKLHYNWFFYKEPGSYTAEVSVSSNDAAITQVRVPSDAAGKTIHIILELSDGDLTSYRRIIIRGY
jgi:hypothetical protein